MRGLPAIPIIALFCCPLFAQSTNTRPTFEIADVHSSGYSSNPYTYMSGGMLRGERYDLRKATMLDLISTAYKVDPKNVVGEPNWLELDRFDVSAKAPAGTPPATLRLMLQNLLEDRFKLALHKDTRPMPAFVLTMGKGKPKMTEAQGSGDTGCRYQGDPDGKSGGVYACHGMTMASFAEELQNNLDGEYLTEPVVDQTGIEGSWDFDLKWNWRSQILPAGATRTTVFDAVEKQLGLSLELKTAPAPAIVVDQVNESPTDNPPGVEQMLPPRPVEFEVANIKRSAPDEQFFYKLYPGGLFVLKGVSMKLLIAAAWDIDWGHMDNWLAAPKWTDSVNFDINAKTEPDSGPLPSSGFIDDDLRLMMRAMLIDRFKMVTHYENRLETAYTLVSEKAKMAKADPSNRSGCNEGGAMKNDPRDTNPLLSRLVVCKNMTMAQFARAFQGLAPGYVPNEVVDGTGLDGAWDFTLSFSSAGVLQESLRDAEDKTDPSGGVSLFEAVRKELGLKLEMRKRVMPVVVIDQMQENPTDN